MSEDRPTSLRFPIILALSIVCLAVTAWADYQAGMDAYGRGDYAAALRELRPLAEQGDSGAQFYLGLLYENGDGVPRDFVKARQWYEKAADGCTDCRGAEAGAGVEAQSEISGHDE
jgi:Sel1 repeat